MHWIVCFSVDGKLVFETMPRHPKEWYEAHGASELKGALIDVLAEADDPDGIFAFRVLAYTPSKLTDDERAEILKFVDETKLELSKLILCNMPQNYLPRIEDNHD